MIKDIFTVADIACILKVSEKFVTSSIKRGELQAVKAKQWRITLRDAVEYIRLKRSKS